MSKHTPGPWSIRVGAIRGHYCAIMANDGNAVADIPITTNNTQHHNAPLIAAAPELLAALEMVDNMLDTFPGFDSAAVPFTDEPTGNIGQVVRAAIRRATGTVDES